MIIPPTPEHILNAAQRLAAGELLGLPTETVYGLAADASNAAAVALIYSAKGRPADHPLIVHLAPQADLSHWAAVTPDFAVDLMKAFWPGPLTLVLPRTAHAKDFITGAQNTVALRCPAHPVAQAVLKTCLGFGIQGLAAPSANRFGRVSPTTAQHVEDEFAGAIATLEGGACDVGIESTIVDCTELSPRVLRHGAITHSQIEQATGIQTPATAAHRAAPRVSGSLAAHYAPATPLRFCSLAAAEQLEKNVVYMGFDAPRTSAFHAMPRDAARYAQQLYATLRALDTMQYSQIAVQPVPHEAAWAGVADRLARAAASF